MPYMRRAAHKHNTFTRRKSKQRSETERMVYRIEHSIRETGNKTTIFFVSFHFRPDVAEHYRASKSKFWHSTQVSPENAICILWMGLFRQHSENNAYSSYTLANLVHRFSVGILLQWISVCFWFKRFLFRRVYLLTVIFMKTNQQIVIAFQNYSYGGLIPSVFSMVSQEL